MQNIITVFAAHASGERDIGPVISYHSCESDANNAAKGKGFYGCDGATSKKKVIQCDGELWLLASDKPIDLDGRKKVKDDRIRAEAISLLSAEQLRVLGLSPAGSP
jgi:hypothetical protein